MTVKKLIAALEKCKQDADCFSDQMHLIVSVIYDAGAIILSDSCEEIPDHHKYNTKIIYQEEL